MTIDSYPIKDALRMAVIDPGSDGSTVPAPPAAPPFPGSDAPPPTMPPTPLPPTPDSPVGTPPPIDEPHRPGSVEPVREPGTAPPGVIVAG